MSTYSRKAVIIGAGHVGSHAAYALASQGIVEEIVFIDIDEAKAAAQAQDIYDATVYLPTRSLLRAGNYSDVRDAALLVVAAGPLPDIAKGESDRNDTLGASIAVIKDIVIHLRDQPFTGILLSITNPADVIAHYLQHSLNLPAARVLSTGTTLDSARLRRVLAEELGVDQKSIAAYSLGEHGETQSIAWSHIRVGELPLESFAAARGISLPDRAVIRDRTRGGGWEVLRGKGSTEFGIGASIAEVARAILLNENRILPVSTLLQGEYGQKDVYASVPALLGAGGVAGIIELELSPDELKEFSASCATIHSVYQRALGL